MKDSIDTTTVLMICFAFALVCASLLDCSPAYADDRVDQELALAVAKTAMNEASFGAAPADLYLIWQVVEARGRTSEARLSWLRAHSSCVNTDRPLEEREAAGNCRWSRHLEWSDSAPEGWPEHLRWEGWRQRRWQQLRTRALQLVRGAQYERPCAGTPRTWGGPMDRARALARGLVPLGCTGTVNEGFAPATRGDS